MRRSMAIFHRCAHEGSKIEILRDNTPVRGQAVRDLLVVGDECDHNYATCIFRGKVSFLEALE